MEIVFRQVIETIIGFLIITCGVPPEDLGMMSELVSTSSGTRFVCTAQLNSGDVWLVAGKLYRLDDPSQSPFD